MITRYLIILNSFLLSFFVLIGCNSLSYGKSQTLAPANGSTVGRETTDLSGTDSLAPRPVLEASSATLLVSSVTMDGKDSTVNISIPTGSALIAINRLFSTTLGIVGPDYKVVMSSSPAGAIENIQVSQMARKVAYLVLEGINPGNNYIETVNLTNRETRRMKAHNGFAILGFILEPLGKRLVFTEVGLLGTSSRQASWHLMVADLEKGWVKEILTFETPQVPGETALIPFAWSDKTGEVYLYGIRPFSGGWGQGIWAIQPDGFGLRQLMPESKFIRLPLLSPDGLQFAYLTSNIEALPSKYIPSIGAPPGNVLLIRDLKTGQEHEVIQIKERTFSAVAWSFNGEKLILSRQEWQENNLRDTGLVFVPIKASGEREIVDLLQASNITYLFDFGPDGAVLWVNKSQKGSELVLKKKAAAPVNLLLSVPDGEIKIIGYLK